jgi:hypothetical protein
VLPLLAHAAEFVTGEQPSVASGVAVKDDLYLFGGNVSMSGDITGDLIAGGGSVLIGGNVTEDIAVGGGNVTILGDVGDDLRVGGGNIIVSGSVAGDVLAGGGQIQLAGDRIGGDLAVGAGTLRLDSPVAGDAQIGGGDIYINASIAGNLEVQADKVTLGPEANVAGDFIYSSPRLAVIEDGAVIGGETSYTETKGKRMSKSGMAAIFSVALLVKVLMTFVGALAFTLVFKRYFGALLQRAVQSPLAHMGLGIVFLIVTPILSLVLLITVLGIPLGMLGLIGFAGALIFASLAAPVVLGSVVDKWMFKRHEYRITWVTVLIGVALYVLVGLIPFIGWIAKFLVFLVTIGAVLNVKWSIAKEWR